MFCSYDYFIQKNTSIPDIAAKGVDMSHTNRPYKSGCRYRRYCRFPRISSSFLFSVSIIAFSWCRFSKETDAVQYPPARNLEALPLMRYNSAAVSFRRNRMKNRQRQKDILFSILIFCSAFAVNLLIQKLFTTQTLVPMIFVFGVFLISLKTHALFLSSFCHLLR